MELYYNAILYHGLGDAFIVERGRYGKVGARDDLAAVHPEAKRVDLGGRYVIPGFNDCHCHIMPYGFELQRAYLGSPPAKNIADVQRILRAWALENPERSWITGSRYDQNKLAERRHPTRQELDEVSREIPVIATQTSGHAMAVNSKALEVAGIDRNSPNPTGGEIVRGEDGDATGVLLETAMDYIWRVTPDATEAERVDAVVRASGAMAAVGITSAGDAATWGERDLAAYRKASAAGAHLRMTLMPLYESIEQGDGIISREEFAKSAGDDVRFGPVKLFSDGALTTRTAALREPYVDTGTTGLPTYPDDELQRLIWNVHRAGWQCATHAIGDRAIETVLGCYRVCLNRQPRPDARHRIEHFMLADPDLVSQAYELGVLAVMQPEFIAWLGDAYIDGLGVERASRLNAYLSCRRAGVRTPFSSDLPVIPGAPLDGIRAAAARRTPKGVELGSDERLSVADALACYTEEAAYASFDEGCVGRIAEGERADFVALSHDLTQRLAETQVEVTVAAGRVVFGAP